MCEGLALTVGASLLAKNVNDKACFLNERGAGKFFASKLAPTALTLAQPVVMQRTRSRFDLADPLLMGVYIQVCRQLEIVLLGAPGNPLQLPGLYSGQWRPVGDRDRKSTRLNSSH